MVLQCVNITQKVVKGENISSLELECTSAYRKLQKIV